MKPFFSLLYQLLRHIHHLIPLKIRKIYAPFYWKIREYVLIFILTPCGNMAQPLRVYEGKNLLTGDPFRIGYYGTWDVTPKYWAFLLLAPGAIRKDLGRKWPWQVRRLIKTNQLDNDVLLTEANAFNIIWLASLTAQRISHWIYMEIDATKAVRELGHSKRSDIPRKIRQNQLSFEVSHDPDQFKMFYETMYVPYAKIRYEEAPALFPYSKLFDMFKNGELILIKQGPLALAGGVVEYQKKQALFRVLGIKDGNWEYVKKGVIGAIYYFTIQQAQKHGYSDLQLGGTRGILTDGVQRYKTMLGARINPHLTKYPLRLFLLKDSAGLRKFLIQNPFIYSPDGQKPCRAIFIDNGPESAEEAIREKLATCRCHGVEDTTFFTFDESAMIPHQLQNSTFYSMRIIPTNSVFLKN